MNDTFTFVAPVMPRRELDPFALRLALAAGILVLVVGAFGAFVVQQERASDARRASLEARITEQAEARAAAVTSGGDEVAAVLDEEARSSAGRALELATDAYAASSSLTGAGAAQLADAQPSMLFVDGASTSPAVVSVEAAEGSWSAAVMGPSGVCYWVAMSPDGGTRYGTGHVCTGAAAAAAADPSW